MPTRYEPGRIVTLARDDWRPERSERQLAFGSDDWLDFWEDLEHAIRRRTHMFSHLGYGGSWIKGNLWQIVALALSRRGREAPVQGTQRFLDQSPYALSSEAMSWLLASLDSTTYRDTNHADEANLLLRSLLAEAASGNTVHPEVRAVIRVERGLSMAPLPTPVYPSASLRLQDAEVSRHERIRSVLAGPFSPWRIVEVFPPAPGHGYSEEETRDALRETREALPDEDLVPLVNRAAQRTVGAARWLFRRWLAMLTSQRDLFCG